ncbi:Glutamate receptor 2 isoform 1 [Dorcoceras hygrometricum]|uniref:Glutamate receptor 2 isoform 1 n=1 Tax=Dorcoceras hygrometricum TaxID=472368 RepID=A0A2Z7C8X7_9LAMI|nr:Glutamate receptor 2 isoform 1 [Dorcoceras hygrometricum]
MSWRDDAYTLSPSTPEQAPDMTKFLEVMSEKCFNAQELIEEDLLCHFSFSGKKVQLVGNLDDRMTNAEMIKSLKERKANPEGTSSSHRPSKGKRKASSEGGERRKKRHHEEQTTESTRAIVPKDPMGELSGTARKAPEQIEQQSIETLVWTGEAANRLTQAHDEVVMTRLISTGPDTRRSKDGVLGRHNDLMKQLEEIRAQKDGEKGSLLLELEATRDEVQSSKAQAQTLEARLLHSEEEKGTLQAEVERLKGEGEPRSSLRRVSMDARTNSRPKTILKRSTNPVPRRGAGFGRYA